jgi:T5orf172 domain
MYSLLEKKNKKVIRIGKSILMKNRWSTYNTAVPDDFKLLYYVKVPDPTAVEKCVQAMLHKYIYREKKDYYICTEKKLMYVFFRCKIS